MARRKKNEKARADAAAEVARDPGVSNANLARTVGLSKTAIQRIRHEPEFLAAVKARLAAGGPIESARGSVAGLLGALGVVADRMLADGDTSDDSVARMLQLLAGLTGTLERMSRAGIDLTALASPDDTRALAGELARAYHRGTRAAGRYRRAERWARWLADRHAAAGPMDPGG
jgi:hypothetical protein